jgi:hypothetical protein
MLTFLSTISRYKLPIILGGALLSSFGCADNATTQPSDGSNKADDLSGSASVALEHQLSGEASGCSVRCELVTGVWGGTPGDSGTSCDISVASPPTLPSMELNENSGLATLANWRGSNENFDINLSNNVCREDRPDDFRLSVMYKKDGFAHSYSVSSGFTEASGESQAKASLSLGEIVPEMAEEDCQYFASMQVVCNVTR